MLLSPIPSGFLIEERATLPAPVIYTNAAAKIGEFGDCAAVLLRFFTSISVAREAAARLRHHPLANNMPASEIAKSADGLIKIAEMGMELFPFFETDIESEDGVDSDAVKEIQQASKEWNTVRKADAQETQNREARPK